MYSEVTPYNIEYYFYLLDYVTLGGISKCREEKKIKIKIEPEPEPEPKLCKINATSQT